ncbi:hypothetical protein [Bacteroides stercorirosoris]|uniref:hypothetical protein n=1 Tax=Bacteroides stercorirosoris TaxID=871324 RepID=UPI0035216B95
MKNSNSFFKNAIKWALIVLLSLAAFNLGASIGKGPLVEKHISYRNNVEQITNINHHGNTIELELSDPTKQVINTEITYNYDGIIYFLGMIICLILVFLILSPLKYEYHEFIHDEWREVFNKDLEECNRKIGELNKQITNVTQKTTNE